MKVDFVLDPEGEISMIEIIFLMIDQRSFLINLMLDQLISAISSHELTPSSMSSM